MNVTSLTLETRKRDVIYRLPYLILTSPLYLVYNQTDQKSPVGKGGTTSNHFVSHYAHLFFPFPGPPISNPREKKKAPKDAQVAAVGHGRDHPDLRGRQRGQQPQQGRRHGPRVRAPPAGSAPCGCEVRAATKRVGGELERRHEGGCRARPIHCVINECPGVPAGRPPERTTSGKRHPRSSPGEAPTRSASWPTGPPSASGSDAGRHFYAVLSRAEVRAGGSATSSATCHAGRRLPRLRRRRGLRTGPGPALLLRAPSTRSPPPRSPTATRTG